MLRVDSSGFLLTLLAQASSCSVRVARSPSIMIDTTNTEIPSANGTASRCRTAIATNTSANSAAVLPSSRNDRPRDGLPSRAVATRRPPMRTSSQKSAHARPAPTPAATAPRAPHKIPARHVINAPRIRLMRSIRASTAASAVAARTAVAVALALVSVHHAHDPFEGGPQPKKHPEVHDPVCVEFAMEGGAAVAADHETESYLDSEGARDTRRAPHFFAIRVDGAAFP